MHAFIEKLRHLKRTLGEIVYSLQHVVVVQDRKLKFEIRSNFIKEVKNKR